MIRGAWVILFSLLPLTAVAQEATRIPFDCAPDLLQSAGLLCTEEEPCAIYMELTGIAPAGRKLFLAGNLHATAGTLASILLASEDGGRTWKEPAARIAGAGLETIQIYDLEHGWVAGETQYPLPSDPFFLITSDGGMTWHKRPVSEDGGPGSVLRFHFDSAQHGEMVIDAGKSSPGGRYVAWETQTGGDTWMVRSAMAKAPAVKNVVAAEDFRIRALDDKTYRVEKRSGETWEKLSDLAIELASCKLKPDVAKEPPAITDETEPKDYVEEIKLGTPAKTTATPAIPKKKGPGF